MSEIFHKSCYTTRSTGYKYRTLSTNTGDKKHRDDSEDNLFDRKFKELKRAITSRINEEVEQIADARETMLEKYNKIDAKISSLIELHHSINSLRKNLGHVETVLEGMVGKVEKLEAATGIGTDSSALSKRSSFRSRTPIFEEEEIFSTAIAH